MKLKSTNPYLSRAVALATMELSGSRSAHQRSPAVADVSRAPICMPETKAAASGNSISFGGESFNIGGCR